MEFDIRMTVALLVAAASGYLIVLFLRKLFEGIDKASEGALSRNKVLRWIGVVLDTLLPWLPCIPSGFLAVLVMSYWPPDALWGNTLLYFLLGSLAGVVSQTLYYSVTRAIKKQADRVAEREADSKSPPAPGS